MTHEQPRILFFHYWGRGSAKDLANTLKGVWLRLACLAYLQSIGD